MTSPYRQEKPLTEIIPPDRRRLKVAALVFLSMVLGALALQLGTDLWRAAKLDASSGPPERGLPAQRHAVSLHGQAGALVVPPPGTKSVVHVWLQGCADCMPAFEAMRALKHDGGLGVDVPVINVAYGEADPLWAGSYGVLDNLVYDPSGAALVRPNGIGTFTTLVFDERGAIIHRDRPDRPGYRDRIRKVVGAAPLAASPPLQRLSASVVEGIVAQHRVEVRQQCFDGRGKDEAVVTAHVEVAPNGSVALVVVDGNDRGVSRCVEEQIRAWTFPSFLGPANAAVDIPFRFYRL